MDRKIPRIFVGGTGRSGTTILYKILGRHRQIYSLRDEIRFIIDYNGLTNIVHSLTSNYSPAQGGRALVEFEKFLKTDLTSPATSPYPWCDFKTYLGGDSYIEIVDEFLEQLQDGEFDGTTAWMKDRSFSGIGKIKRRIHNRTKLFPDSIQMVPIPKYFADQSELYKIIEVFLDKLFMIPTVADGKETWCEKTAHNILHYEFIKSIFPNSLFIHIKRDPRSVVQSYMRQTWAPTDVGKSCQLLKNIYSRWFSIKQEMNVDQDPLYLEVKLEDFVADPSGLLASIRDKANLDSSFEIPDDLDAKRMQRAAELLSKSERATIDSYLEKEIVSMGYEI